MAPGARRRCSPPPGAQRPCGPDHPSCGGARPERRAGTRSGVIRRGPNGPLPRPLRSARLDAEVSAAVLGPALLGVLTAHRLLFAVAYDRDAVGPHAVGDEVVHRGLGPAIAEGQVVFAGATLVGVTLDQDQVVGVRLEPLRI